MGRLGIIHHTIAIGVHAPMRVMYILVWCVILDRCVELDWCVVGTGLVCCMYWTGVLYVLDWCVVCTGLVCCMYWTGVLYVLDWCVVCAGLVWCMYWTGVLNCTPNMFHHKNNNLWVVN